MSCITSIMYTYQFFLLHSQSVVLMVFDSQASAASIFIDLMSIHMSTMPLNNLTDDTLCIQENLNLRDAREQASTVWAGPQRRSQSAKSVEQDDAIVLSVDRRGRAIPSALSRTSEVQRTGPTSTSEGLDEDEPSQDEKEEETSSAAASEESDDEEEKNSQADKAPAEMEEVDKIRTELSTQLMQSEKRVHGGDSRITGDLETNGNTYAMNIMDEIRSISTTVSGPSSNSISCGARWSDRSRCRSAPAPSACS